MQKGEVIIDFGPTTHHNPDFYKLPWLSLQKYPKT